MLPSKTVSADELNNPLYQISSILEVMIREECGEGVTQVGKLVIFFRISIFSGSEEGNDGIGRHIFGMHIPCYPFTYSSCEQVIFLPSEIILYIKGDG